MLETKWGFTVAETLDFKTQGVNEQNIEGADALIYNELGVTLLGTEEDPIPLLKSLDDEYFIAPEKVVYLLEEQPPTTWGIRTTGADRPLYRFGSPTTVLDTGFDAHTPTSKRRR